MIEEISLTEELDSGLGGRTRRLRWDQLTSTTAAKWERTKQRIVERHHIPDGAFHWLIARRPTVGLGSDSPEGVEVGQRRIHVSSVDVVRLQTSVHRLKVRGRGDLVNGGWVSYVITYISLRPSGQRVDRWLLLSTISAHLCNMKRSVSQYSAL